ncbi:MAG: TAT-variant-translocated molybdopterin oxidoreductase, partial [Acidobacteriota bacterium]
MSRTYWRSLAEVEGSPEFRHALEREFPEGASELPDGITRREMMMLVGASLSLAGLAGCMRRPVEEIVPYVTAPEEVIPGIPRYYATTMPFRRSAYGLIVESHEGRPTKIEGNPAHPSTLGGSSALIQASVLGLYDPDRSQSVTLKGARKSWNDFVTAWGQLAQAHAADGGAGLAVLTESFSSPTLTRLVSELRARYPQARWATYDAVSDENRLTGLKQATGRDLDLMLRFDRASVILALDADPLLTDPEMVRHARGFAEGRRAGSSGGVMNRLYAVEGVYSLTGAMADHRLRLTSRQIAPFLAALAAKLGAAGASAADLQGVDPRWLDALAKDLLANRGKGLIVAGARQPAAVHAAVCALNTHLGNTAKTVSYYETKDAALPSVASLASLVAAMKGGEVKTLVILGGNPVFDAPADLGFASAMSKVPHTIALGHNVDETSSKAEWHIPRAHYLESWGDARAAGGTLSIVQPLILPLFGGRTAVEVLGLMASGKDRPGYDIVRETWKPMLGDAEFDILWNRVLHDGLLPGRELPEVVPDLTADAVAGLARLTDGAAAPSASALEIVFLPSPSLHDGRFANDGWLQELPDPLTKLTWDNPALVSPKTAETAGVANGEVVRVDYAGRSLELPVWIQPGMADGVVALTLGYGRVHAGRVGSGVGFDAFTIRTSRAETTIAKRESHHAVGHAGQDPDRKLERAARVIETDHILVRKTERLRGFGAHERGVVPGELGQRIGKLLQPPVVRESAVVKPRGREEHDLQVARRSCIGSSSARTGAAVQAGKLRKRIDSESRSDFGKLAAGKQAIVQNAVPLLLELGLAEDRLPGLTHDVVAGTILARDH